MGEKTGKTNTLLIVLIITGVVLFSCMICVLAPKISGWNTEKKENREQLKAAEIALEKGNIEEAENTFRASGQYEKYSKKIDEAKKRKAANLKNEAAEALTKKDYSKAYYAYDEARKYEAFDSATTEKYKEAKTEYLKGDIPKTLKEAESDYKNLEYSSAKEKADDVIKRCGELENINPKAAAEIGTGRIKDKATKLSEELTTAIAKADEKRNAEAEMSKNPSTYVTVKNNWYAGGFGSVAIHNFTVTNKCSFPIKNIELSLTYFTGGGDICNSKEYTIRDKIAANSTKGFHEVNLGFIDDQAKTCSVELVGAEKY
jgi:hypothetical protein